MGSLFFCSVCGKVCGYGGVIGGSACSLTENTVINGDFYGGNRVTCMNPICRGRAKKFSEGEWRLRE